MPIKHEQVCLSGRESVKFFLSFVYISIVVGDPVIKRLELRSINRHNHVTCLFLSLPSQVLDFQRHMSWFVVCSARKGRMWGDYWLCWYWWKRWSAFHNTIKKYYNSGISSIVTTISWCLDLGLLTSSYAIGSYHKCCEFDAPSPFREVYLIQLEVVGNFQHICGYLHIPQFHQPLRLPTTM